MRPEVHLLPADQIAHVHEGMLHSPFFPRTSALNINQQWIIWNGFAAAVVYREEEIEYFSTRNTCGVFDVSPMRKYRLSGASAEAMLNRMVTRDVTKQRERTVAYNIWCNDRGRIIDDGTLFRLGPQDFMLCAADPALDWLLLSADGFGDTQIEDISDDIAALALQGPTSCALLKALGFAGVDQLKPFQIGHFPFENDTIMISRTGYTGDLGYELWLPPGIALSLWDALFSVGIEYGIQPLGDSALDRARVEAGYLAPDIDFHGALHTVTLNHDHSPLELGLDWMVNFNKLHFNGRAALATEQARGPKWRLLRLDVEGNKPAESSILYSDRKCSNEVGYVTSAYWSPAVKANIAYGLVKAKHADGSLYAEVYHQNELRWRRRVCKVNPVSDAFWSPPRARQTPPPDC